MYIYIYIQSGHCPRQQWDRVVMWHGPGGCVVDVWGRDVGSTACQRRAPLYFRLIHCNAQQHTATHCNTPQYTATHCNTLQHTATHCNTLQRAATRCDACSCDVGAPACQRRAPLHFWYTCCNMLQHAATCCNILQHTATHCNAL